MKNINKNISFFVIKRSIFAIIALCSMLIALIGLGSIIEENQAITNLLAHFIGKTLIIIFAFFAAKIPLLYLIKGTVISGSISTVMWREIIHQKTLPPKQKKHKLDDIISLNDIIGLSSTNYIKQKLNSFEVY